MSYWKNDELESVKQTQRAITSRNGLSYSGGQRVEITVPPNIKLFDGRKTYLNFDVKLKLPAGLAPTRLTLDPKLGGQSLIKNVRIYSNGGVGGGRTLLEEIVDYNCKVALQYDYDTDESMRKMRAMKEGAQVETPANRGTLGTSHSQLCATAISPFFQGESDPYATAFDDTKMLTQKISMPLHTGIFSDSLKAFPNEIVGGLLVELDTEMPERVIKQLDTVNKNRRTRLNPVFAGIDAADAGTLTAWAADGATSENIALWVKFDNNNVSVENFPFVVGETFGLVKKDSVGSIADLTTDGDVQVNPVITGISGPDAAHSNYIKIEYATTRNSTSSEAITIDDAWVMYSTAIDTARPVAPNTLVALSSYPATYQMSNVELVVQSLELSPESEKKMMDGLKGDGAMELDIMSVTNYKHSLLKDNRQATINLPLSNTRAKSVIVVPTDASVYSSAQLIGAVGTYVEEEKTAQDVFDTILRSNRSGMVGCIDGQTDYIMNIDDELVPSRPVSVSKANKGLSLSAQHLVELEKSLTQGGIVPRSFSEYNRNYCFGRAYSSGVGVADLRNRTNQIQMSYNETAAPSVNKLLMCMVFHQRKIVIKQGSISVEL